MKVDEQQKRAAREFVARWTLRRGSEKGEDQQFWNDLLGTVLGTADVVSRVQYQVPVPLKGATGFLDAWIPETRVLIEHKSRGIDLDAPQAGHGGLTPYGQAAAYDNARPYGEKARWIVTCNFDTFQIYDRTRPLAAPFVLRLADLPKELYRLAFLVDPKEKSVAREREISVQAGRIVAELYDALLKRYAAADSAALAALNRLCVRLVFCLYAEDAGVFPKNVLKRLLAATPADFLRTRLVQLFQTLDTPAERRGVYLEPELAAFPYTNGGLFRGASESEVPPLTEEIRQLLLKACAFDWRGITPTIFGALFESTLNPATRRAGGMVYTSVKNIHKVIDPLFLDGLTRRVDDALAAGAATAKARRTLDALQDELASLTFLDPACGSGNFLTETYLSLRRLENRLIAARQNGQGELDLGQSVRVTLAQFHGIEINDFAVAVAKTALWIAEAQMQEETARILHREPEYLPLRDQAGITEGDALRLDWPRTDYIMGNPPFVGYSLQSKEQKAEMLEIFRDEEGKPCKAAGKIDYVAAWYWRACSVMSGTSTRAAFVSTNSIVQGEQVAPVWQPLMERQGLEIDFAWKTFVWDSEASEKAHVHVVIVGFHVRGNAAERTPKTLFEDGKAFPAAHINGYLMDGPDVFMKSRTKPLCAVPSMITGNRPAEGGHLIIEERDYETFAKREPGALPYIKKLIGSAEFINNKKRWCLWLVGVSPHILRSLPLVMQRVELCRQGRLHSPDAGRRALAATPALFRETNNPKTAVVVPSVSSERREYVPMGFIDDQTIATNLVLLVPDGTLYHFGVLTSSVHMAWMRVVCGRLEMRYRYSAAIVYNNFPWPEGADEASITGTAQAILDVRARYPDASLADLYDPLTMPPDLRAAHRANDKAVLAAYGLRPDTPEPEIVARLFRLYAAKTGGGAGRPTPP